MMEIASDDPIIVRAIGMDDRKLAVFRLAFRMYTKTKYQLAESGQSYSLVIADLDTNSEQEVILFGKEHPNIPLLAVSSDIHKLAGFEFYLKKPMRMETLFPVLTRMKNLGTHADVAMKNNGTRENIVVDTHATHAGIVADIHEERSRDTSHGNAPLHQKFNNGNQKPIEYFSMEEGLLGTLNTAVRDGTVIGIGKNGRLLWSVDSKAGIVKTVLSEDLECRELADIGGLASLGNMYFTGGERVFQRSLSSFLWMFSYYYANGRLPSSIKATTKLKLTKWPNLTRLKEIPESVRLSAFFSRSAASPAIAMRILNIQQDTLCNYIAAANMIGVLDYKQDDIEHSVAGGDHEEMAVQGAPETVEPTPQRSFLGRLLAKISGI